MSIFTPIESSYSNHAGGAFTHPATHAVYFCVTWRKESAGPYRLQIWEDAPPYGDPKLIREWATGTADAGPGPWGYGTCTWLPDGSLYVIAPGGVIDSAHVQPAIHIERNVFPAFPVELIARPQGGVEGGELVLIGAAGYPTWHIDASAEDLRIFGAGGEGAIIANASGVYVPDGAGGLRKV